MKANSSPIPTCIIIAGPNGSGKTTLATEFLPKEGGVVHFVNADLIASGLSPLRPELAAAAAGRIFLAEIDRLAGQKTSFAFETTLSGKVYVRRIKKWKASGFRVEIVFLYLSSPQIALRRIEARVKRGGHAVPKEDVLRRFSRGWDNFKEIYRPLADEWVVFDNSGEKPRLMDQEL